MYSPCIWMPRLLHWEGWGKKILVLLLQQVLEPGKKWRSCLPLTLVLAWSVFEDGSLTIHFCLTSVMRPLLNPLSPTRWMRH